ncbi:protein PELPK1-like [Cornus florida]|uniref:protein PELPK1-like n=1 Tax=Cornus florida TaxID=4283 RepID=UPI0028A27BFD|nr:protein PELPK1-like [Cornus florida]
MASFKHFLILPLIVVLSLSNIQMGVAGRLHLLQTSPTAAPTLPNMPPLPKAVLPPLPAMPKTTLPSTQIPSLPNPTLPTMPAIPKVTLPPLPATSLPTIPTTMPTIPLLSPPPSAN